MVELLGRPVLINTTEAAVWIIRFKRDIQPGVIGVEAKQNGMDYMAEWAYEEEDELVIEKAELER